ncbi:L-fucose isomerase [Synergistales bacterium]|nr:L-fucose isomerase [Synergistales bacterium]
MNNVPKLKIALVAVSRDNFSRDISTDTLRRVEAQAHASLPPVFACDTLVENEADAMKALSQIQDAECNALVVLLGNFGPETPETILAQYFPGPSLYLAAAEDASGSLYDARRDAYCGLLNCSYNLDLRNISAFIPAYPVGVPSDMKDRIAEFAPIARAAIGIKKLKIITFGPRPKDFFACNAPIKPLYNLGVEIQENSELDLALAWRRHEGDKRISALVEQMKYETKNTKYAEVLPKMAQYELTLLDWAEENKGSRQYVAFANKCWPAFQKEFGFLPCYVHGRLGSQGIPVGCETDIYGALSEYIGTVIGESPVTLLDINNSIPEDAYQEYLKSAKSAYRKEEMFIGFHCGNTPISLLAENELRYKMNRKDPNAPETGKEETRGTLEGRIAPGEISAFRLHGNAEGHLQAYIAKGEILPVELNTYGCYALFGIPEMARFYRHVLLEKHFPHHSAVMYGHAAALYDLFNFLGVSYIGYNHSKGDRYERENPFRMEF